jgi:transmembrane sensor
MALSKERILYLLNAYSNNKAIEAEEQELFAWVNETDNHDLLKRHIRKVIEQSDSNQPVCNVDLDHLYDHILGKSVNLKPEPALYQMSWVRWSAAAIIILFGAVAYLYMNQSSAKKIIAAKVAPKRMVNDVPAPAGSKAVLTLADGSKIQLDSINNGTLARQGNVKIVKQPDGQITYNGAANEDLYNTLNVPRGSKVVTIRLSDGTQVWLNSESSLRYPASFKGTERKVEITGEAYFEVAHNPAMPFVVKKDAMEVRVLGTHFNIDTYQDEGINKITLLEGSVKISLNNHQNLLKPGQQAQIKDDIKLVSGVDLEEVVAWKNGKFQFGEKADLHLIMKKIARWYDVDVDYEGGAINQRFGGELPMSSNLSQVLEILRISGVNFTIDGKKVIVKS